MNEVLRPFADCVGNNLWPIFPESHILYTRYYKMFPIGEQVAAMPTLQRVPRGHWFWGHLAEFNRDRLGFLTRCAREQGDFAYFRLGPKRIVLLSHPDAIEEVLVRQSRWMRKHYALRFFRPILGEGLLTAEGERWTQQRKLMQPLFVPRRVARYAATMVEFAERHIAAWQDGQARELHAEMSHLTLAIACKTLFDTDPSADAAGVFHSLRVALRESNSRFGRFLPLPLWLPTPSNVRLRRSIQHIERIITQLIAERRSRNSPQRDDLLSVLLHARDEVDGSGMSEQQLRDEVMTLFLAGHGTTANALCWTWYLLTQHPQVAEQLQDEWRRVLGDRPVTADDLDHLPYTRNVIYEVLRFFPPAYLIGREACADCIIAGHPIRKGTTLLMSPWVVHRDERFYADAETFRPERWNDGFIKRLPKYAYFPFGGGPRTCIGNHFALMELPLIVATIGRRFRFALQADRPVRIWPAVTLRPENGLHVHLRANEKHGN